MSSSLLNWVGHAANVAQLVGIPLAAIALWIAANQLRDAARTAEKAEIASEAQAVLALDQVLAQQRFEDLRTKLNPRPMTPNNDDKIVLRRYIAAFERLGLLLDRGVMSAELANAFYGSRIRKLVTNAGEFVKEMVTEEGGSRGRPAWRNFVVLWSTMETYSEEDRDRPKAPPIPQPEPRDQHAREHVAGTS
jgi:hypothetical protein